MLANRARITYDEAQRDRCLVEIALAIGRWHRQAAASGRFLLELLPDPATSLGFLQFELKV
jgi:hypothetical protein